MVKEDHTFKNNTKMAYEKFFVSAAEHAKVDSCGT